MNNVLIISNNSLSHSDSNGRTLLNLINGLNNDFHFYQFSMNKKFEKDFTISENYVLSDQTVLNGIRHLKFNLGDINPTNDKRPETKNSTRKNSFTMLLRYYMWCINFKFNKKLINWVKTINPVSIIFQAGDSIHLYRLAIKLCKILKIKLVIYNSEDYPFKRFDYFKKKTRMGAFYRIFNHKLNKYVKKAYEISNLNVFLTDELAELYGRELGIKGVCIPNSSTLIPSKKGLNTKCKIIRYFGNLDNNREQSLLTIAKLIEKYNLNFKIEIYSSKFIDSFKSYSFVRQMGFIDYEKLKPLIVDADVNLHVESFDCFYVKDVRFGFSTKIPDIIRANRIFLLYAPKELYLSRLIAKNNLGYFACNTDELLNALIEISEAKENIHSLSMLNYSNKHFDLKRNSEIFATLFKELL